MKKTPATLLVSYITTVIITLILMFANSKYYFGFNNHDRPPSFAGYLDRNCLRTEVVTKPCTYLSNKKLPPTIALIGDSHAASYSQVVIDAAKTSQRSVDIWSLNGCKYVAFSILSKKQRTFLKSNSRQCYIRNHKFDKELRKKTYKVVFVTWRTATMDNLFLNLYGKNFDTLMSNSLKYLGKFTNVVLIGPSPEMRDKSYLEPRALFGKYHKPKKLINIKEMNQEILKSINFFSNVSVERLTIINVLDKFCRKDQCKIIEDNRSLYFDYNHVSEYGASKILQDVVLIINKYSDSMASR